jgi:hypothetical protein
VKNEHRKGGDEVSNPKPGQRDLRKIEFATAVAHCAPPPGVVVDIVTAAQRSDDPHAYLDDLLDQARRAA